MMPNAMVSPAPCRSVMTPHEYAPRKASDAMSKGPKVRACQASSVIFGG